MLFKEERPRPHWLFLLAFIFLFLPAHPGCHLVGPSFSPRPPSLESLEGYASMRMVGDGEASRSRFSFVFSLPQRGRIEASDFVGRAISQIFITEEGAFLVVPSKKAYWRGTEDEIAEKFLGFSFSLPEMVCLLSGDWSGSAWSVETDERGRIQEGQKGELRFTVKEFFGRSSVPRLITIDHARGRGRLKILEIRFNRRLRSDSFHLYFQGNDSYRQVSWQEIEQWLAK